MADRRVLQLLGPSSGGISRHVGALGAALGQRSWDVAMSGPARVLEELGGDPDDVVEVPASLQPVGRARAQLAAVVAGREPTLVHAHGLKAGWVAAAVAGRVPVVVTVHNVVLRELAGWKTPVLRHLEARLPARVTGLVAVSAEVAARFAPRRVPVIPPIGPRPAPRRTRQEVRAGLGVDSSTRLVVVVARLHPQKDLATLVEAVPLLRSFAPDVRVVVAGEGPERAQLERRIDEVGVGDVVTLLGPRADSADLLAAADVVAITSRWESGPLVLFEALELGRPVVCTPVGHAPVLLGDGGGRLVPAGDATALASALAEVLDDPHEALRMAERGRQAALALLEPDRLVQDVLDVYEAALRQFEAMR